MEAEVPRAECAIKVNPFIPGFNTLLFLYMSQLFQLQKVFIGDHSSMDGGVQELRLVRSMDNIL